MNKYSNKYNIKYFFIVLLLFIYSLFNIGGSSFVINKEIDIRDISISNGAKAVCYFIKDNKTYKYTSIEKALDVAKNDNTNNTIYVIPGTNPIITRDCEIASGDSLILPYEGETYEDAGRSKQHNTFIDADAAGVSEYRKSLVKVEDNVTITNNGTIIVGGELGKGASNQRPTGHTVGKYSEILLGYNSQIINNNNAVINLFGYIKEHQSNNESLVTFNNGSKIYLPFVIYDFRGGSYSSAANSQNVMPFNIFDFPNIHSQMKFNYGSTLFGLLTVYASDNVNIPDPVSVLGKSNSLFLMSNSCSINIKYNSVSHLYTTLDTGPTITSSNINKTEIKINGDLNLTKLNLTFISSIDTSKYYCPLSYKFKVVVESGTTTLVNKVKFYTGSELIVNTNGKLVIGNNSIFYQKYTDECTYASGNILMPPNLGPAKLINNGQTEINSSFGGNIETNTAGAKVITSSGFKSTITSDEVLSASTGGASWTYKTITGYALGKIANSASDVSSNLRKFKATNSYTSQGNWWQGSYDTGQTETISGIKDGSSCITEDTLIMMADGTYKKAIDIRSGDLVMSVNHETGNIEPTPIIFNVHIEEEASNYDVLSLEFSNDKKVEVVYEHGFFDLDTMQYEYIDENNYKSFIGHRFVTIDYINGKVVRGEATLNNGYVNKDKNVRICSPLTYKNLNIITENMLSISGAITGLFNIFEYDENLAYDAIKKQNDIETYGLFEYSEFKDLMPYEVFDAFNVQYYKVAIGKGMLTEKMLDEYIRTYVPGIKEQMNK